MVSRLDHTRAVEIIEKLKVLSSSGHPCHHYVDDGVTPTCTNIGGRGRYRTADRWCVNPGQSVRGVSSDANASPNAQVSGLFVSTVSMECRAVCARLGTLLAQRGFGRRPTAPGGPVPRKRQVMFCAASISAAC